MKMPQFQYLSLAICLLLISGCSAGLIYQSRPEFTPDGYTDESLGNQQYKIVYETYIKDVEEPLLMEFALKRAGEVAAQHHSTIFDVISKKFDFYQSRVSVPEQIIKHQTSGTQGGLYTPGIPGNSYESIIPAHIKEFLVKRVTLVIELPKHNDSDSDTVKPIQSSTSED